MYDANKVADLATSLDKGEFTAADMLHAIALEWSNNWLSIEAFGNAHGMTYQEAAAITEIVRIVATRRTKEESRQ